MAELPNDPIGGAIDSVAPQLSTLKDPVERNLLMQAIARQVGVEPIAIESYLARRDRRLSKARNRIKESEGDDG